MNRLFTYISSQFKNPRGAAGVIVSGIQNVCNRAMYRGTVALVNVLPGEKVLDIGYGNGHLLTMIDRKTCADLYGIDISADAKGMAEKRNCRADADGRLHLSVGDCCDLPYEDDSFSAVTSINTVYFWQDTLQGLIEIRRVLKPGKVFCNVLLSKQALDTIPFTDIGYRKFEISALVDLGRQAGFSSIEVKEIMKDRSYAVLYTK